MVRKTGSGIPLYLMMQKRQETEVTKLSQNNLFLFTVLTEDHVYVRLQKKQKGMQLLLLNDTM